VLEEIAVASASAVFLNFQDVLGCAVLPECVSPWYSYHAASGWAGLPHCAFVRLAQLAIRAAMFGSDRNSLQQH